MTTLSFRSAARDDVRVLVELLADDKLGTTREDSIASLPESYYSAFDAIDSDPNNQLVIAEGGGTIVGFLQLTFIPYLTYRGRWRALIESVRVRSDVRGQNVGAKLVGHAIELARSRPCHLVQLTTDKRRPEALRFYERLGFRATHEGFKLHLEGPAA